MTSETVDAAAAAAATTITSSNASEQTEVFNESKQSHYSMEMYIMNMVVLNSRDWHETLVSNFFDLPHSKLNQRKANDNVV